MSGSKRPGMALEKPGDLKASCAGPAGVGSINRQALSQIAEARVESPWHEQAARMVDTADLAGLKEVEQQLQTLLQLTKQRLQKAEAATKALALQHQGENVAECSCGNTYDTQGEYGQDCCFCDEPVCIECSQTCVECKQHGICIFHGEGCQSSSCGGGGFLCSDCLGSCVDCEKRFCERCLVTRKMNSFCKECIER